MDYSDIFSIIGDLNENNHKVGDYEPVHYKLNNSNETNIEQFLDKFTAVAFNETESEDENFINLVTEESEIIGDNEDDQLIETVEPEEEPENLIENVEDEKEDEPENLIENVEDEKPENLIENVEDEKPENLIENVEDEEDEIIGGDSIIDTVEKTEDNIDQTLGDWTEINLEEVKRENREVKEIAYEEKAKLKQELKEEKETFAEDPKSVYKDINDLITRYRDVI